MIKFRFHAIRPTGIKYSLWAMDYGHYAIHGGEFTRSAYFTQILTEISMIQHIYNLFQEYSTLDSPDLSPGRTQLDTNRTNRTRSSGGKYESARFWGPAEISDSPGEITEFILILISGFHPLKVAN